MYSSSNPKIDIYVKGVYVCSTNWSKTCKDAKLAYCHKHVEIDSNDVKCKKTK